MKTLVFFLLLIAVVAWKTGGLKTAHAWWSNRQNKPADNNTPTPAKKFNWAPWVGLFGRIVVYATFVLFVGFLGSNYPNSFLGTVWQAWNKFFWFFWGSHILMVVGIARYQYDLYSMTLIRLWMLFVPFGVLFIALQGNLKSLENIFSTQTGGDAGNTVTSAEVLIALDSGNSSTLSCPFTWDGYYFRAGTIIKNSGYNSPVTVTPVGCDIYVTPYGDMSGFMLKDGQKRSFSVKGLGTIKYKLLKDYTK